MNTAERLTALAAAHHVRSHRHKWITCFCARRIVGRYEPGVTLGLARALELKVSQVYHLADAAGTLRVLGAWAGPNGRAPDLRYARMGLSPSHFAAAGRKWNKYEMSPESVLNVLVECAEHHATVDDMKAKMDAEFSDESPAPLDFGAGVGMSDDGRQRSPAADLERALRGIVGTVVSVGPSRGGLAAVTVSVQSDEAPAPGDVVELRVRRAVKLDEVV